MKTVELTFPTTTDLSVTASRVQHSLGVYLSSVASSFGTFTDDANSSVKMNSRKFKRFMKNSYVVPFVVVGIVILLLIIVSLHHVFSKSGAVPVAAISTNGRVELRKPLSTQTLNKAFSFPLKDANGKQLSDLKFVVQNIEMRDQIIIQGKIANATIGKDVLIVNLELTNNYTKPIEINTRNYVRLMKNNDGKLYDPKIHNDPVDVQPISTTDTRVGFTVDETDKNFIIRIGDVTDPTAKIQEIKLQLKK